MTGAQLLAALENGVSAYPKMEGRFPCVAGVRLTFDPQLPPNARIRPEDVFVQGRPLDLQTSYRLATKVYLATGRDGYTSLANTPEVVSAENCPTLPVLVRTHLTLLSAASAFLVPNAAVRHAVAKLLRPIHKRATDQARRLASSPSRGLTPSPALAPSPAPSGPTPATTPHIHLLVPSALDPPHSENGGAHHDHDQHDQHDHEHDHDHDADADDPASVPAMCVLSSDDEESYPEIAAAHRRDSSGRSRRRSMAMERSTRPSVLRVVAVVDGRISMVPPH